MTPPASPRPFRDLAILALLMTQAAAAGSTEWTVSSNTDSGTGSLRQAIADAQPGDTIIFDASLSGQNITLTSGQLSIDKNLTIDASALPAGLTIDGNNASRVFEVVEDTTTSLANLTIIRGNATDGGGIWISRGTLTLRDMTLSQNVASDGGGGLYSFKSNVVITNSTISNNTARYAGGLRKDGGSMKLENVTLANNHATSGTGGGIDSYDGTLEIASCTISGNSASESGGGITIFEGTVNLRNTIIVANTATVGPDIENTLHPGTLDLAGTILLGNAADSGLSAGPQVILAAAPLLAPLGDYGGPTQTMPPLPGSPAIDAAGTTDPGGTDQRGFPRFVNDALDIGAVETGSAINGFLVTTTVDENDGIATGGISLRDAIAFLPAGSSIAFAPSLSGQTITLGGTQLTIDKDLTIDASALPAGLTIDANSAVTNHRVLNITSGNTVTLSHLTLSNGKASGSGQAGYGGAILNQGTLTLNNSILSGNSADGGGGVFVVGDGSGGGIANDGGTLTLNNCTLSGNTSYQGGGIFNYNGTLTLNNSTLSGNTSYEGGGIYNGGTLTLKNSIVAGNTAPTGPDIRQSGSYGSNTGMNLIGSTAGAGTIPGMVLTGDPLLAPLGNYGGPTQTMPPLPGSRVIDAAGTTNPGGTDQRGFPRFVNDALDIGAVEIQGTSDSAAILASLWTTNADGDANAFGIEFATGTSHSLSDPAHARAFRMTGLNGSGKPVLTFGLNPAALPFTRWIVRRSTTLLPNDWTEIYRYDGPTMMETATGTTVTPMGALLQVVDDNPPADGVFYRFEADVSP